jgi:YHS domain-containing protein
VVDKKGDLYMADRRWADENSQVPREDLTAVRHDSENDEPPREVINRFARHGQDYESSVRPTETRPERQPIRQSNVEPAAGEPVASFPPRRQANPSNPVTPALGLEGFCPVTLIEKNSWVKGDEQFGVIHRGRLYLFAGPEEKATFFADPDEYSPVLSGVDAVRLAESGEAVFGGRAHGVVYRKRVYLFSSEENLQQFWQDPERYASPIRQAMETGNVGRLFR